MLHSKVKRWLVGYGFSISLLFLINSCAPLNRYKNVSYTAQTKNFGPQALNIFSPERGADLKEVLIFIHGGNWNSGRKSQYNFLGARFARQGIVTVIIDYPLSPEADFQDMAEAAALAVKWTKENISKYGGNPEQIFLAGHSAGGHLAALLAVHDDYFNKLGLAQPLKGVILLDAAGLDMYGYLQEQKYSAGHTYLKTFTSNPSTWKAASPLYHLKPGLPPFLIYTGEETYPSISSSNQKFITAFRKIYPETIYTILPGKKHIPMVTQFLNPRNNLYSEIIRFIKSQR